MESQTHRQKILIADDEESLARLAADVLKSSGFDVICAKDGEEAVDFAMREMPDLLLLDISMPKKDGYAVMRDVRSNPLFSRIPVVMLTSKSQVKDKVQGLEAGVDDYITKPYDTDELVARVKMVLRRSALYTETNPLTKLPGNTAIENRISETIKSGKHFAVLYIDINDFKPFNDHYGYARGDEVIRSTARIILESLGELSYSTDFVGHIGGDDFIVVTLPERIDFLCKKIIEKFDASAVLYYDAKDRSQKFINSKDRLGNIMRFSIISLAIGVISTTTRPFSCVGDVSKTGSQMKSYAKKNKEKGSKYFVDQRKNK